MTDWRDAHAGAQYYAGVGLATVLADFDFETFSEAGFVYDIWRLKWGSLPGLSNQNRGLTACGARNYVQHPSFRIISLAWNLKNGKGVQQWIPPDDLKHVSLDNRHPWELLEHVGHGRILEAWNIPFEWQVWNFYAVPVLGWPVLHVEQCRDAMAKSRASAWPGALEDVGTVRKLTEQKDKAGHDLIRKLTRPRNPTKGNPELKWTPFTASADFQRFYEYNKQDIRTEAEASVRTADLSERELQIWLTDFRINMRGMQINRAAVEDCIAIIEQAEEKYNAEIRQITNGYVSGSSKATDMLEWCRRLGVYLPNLDEDAITDALKRKDYPVAVLRVLRIRQILAFGSVKKFYAFRAQTTAEGRLYDQYVYYGAHTGLWNGRAVQPANLYKGIFSKPAEALRALSIISARCLELVEYEYPEHDALEIIASCLRSMIIARQGFRLISGDFTAIQAVATSCMANEQWRIDVFRTHGKIYEAMASMLTGKPLQFYLDYRKQHGKHHEDRQLGKLAVLSADFGAWVGGWKRFGAEEYGDDAYIKQLILKTRAAIPNVVNFWGGQTIDKFRDSERQHLFGLEGAAIMSILNPGMCFSNRPGSRLAVLYEVYDDVMYCKPPSGGYIQYHAPRLQKSMRPYASAWEYEMSYEGWNSNATKGELGWLRMKLYGGVQTQNVISHMCREHQADKLVALERTGIYLPVMHTHDENVTEVENGRGSLDEYNAIMRTLPSYMVCEDGGAWPIKMPDAWEAPLYGKWED